MSTNRVDRATALATAADYAKHHSVEAMKVQIKLYREQLQSLNNAKENVPPEDVKRYNERIADTRELLRAFESVANKK